MLGAVRGLDGGDSDALIGGSFCGPMNWRKEDRRSLPMRPTPSPRSLFFHKGSAGTRTSKKTGDQHVGAAGGLPSADGGAWQPGQAAAGPGSPGPAAGRGGQQAGAEHPGGTERAERARGSPVRGSRRGLCTLDKATTPEHVTWTWSLQSCPVLCDPMGCSPPGSSVYGDSPGKNTGRASLALLQGIFLTQRLNLSLMSLALASGFFFFFLTTNITWEAPSKHFKYQLL